MAEHGDRRRAAGLSAELVHDGLDVGEAHELVVECRIARDHAGRHPVDAGDLCHRASNRHRGTQLRHHRGLAGARTETGGERVYLVLERSFEPTPAQRPGKGREPVRHRRGARGQHRVRVHEQQPAAQEAMPLRLGQSLRHPVGQPSRVRVDAPAQVQQLLAGHCLEQCAPSPAQSSGLCGRDDAALGGGQLEQRCEITHGPTPPRTNPARPPFARAVDEGKSAPCPVDNATPGKVPRTREPLSGDGPLYRVIR